MIPDSTSSVARTQPISCASLQLARDDQAPATEKDLKSQISNLRFQTGFPVVVSRGPHPFPSRTRKLSLLEPMVLRGQLRGRVGSRRDYIGISNLKFEISKPARKISRAFLLTACFLLTRLPHEDLDRQFFPLTSCPLQIEQNRLPGALRDRAREAWWPDTASRWRTRIPSSFWRFSMPALLYLPREELARRTPL